MVALISKDFNVTVNLHPLFTFIHFQPFELYFPPKDECATRKRSLQNCQSKRRNLLFFYATSSLVLTFLVTLFYRFPTHHHHFAISILRHRFFVLFLHFSVRKKTHCKREIFFIDFPITNYFRFSVLFRNQFYSQIIHGEVLFPFLLLNSGE